MQDIGADRAPALRLDAGNALFKKPMPAQPRELAVAAGMMDIYVAMGYDAVAVGVNDLVAGPDFLKKNAKMPWLSANLIDDQGKNLFPASVTLKRGEMRVGVIGLTGAVPAGQTGLRAGDWRQPLAEAVKALRPECHLLVVLSNLSAADNAELVKNYPDIDLIVTADDRGGNVAPRPEQKPWIVQTMALGKTLGVLTMVGQLPLSIPMNWDIGPTIVPIVPLKMTMPEDPAIADMVRNIQQMAH